MRGGHEPKTKGRAVILLGPFAFTRKSPFAGRCSRRRGDNHAEPVKRRLARLSKWSFAKKKTDALPPAGHPPVYYLRRDYFFFLLAFLGAFFAAFAAFFFFLFLAMTQSP